MLFTLTEPIPWIDKLNGKNRGRSAGDTCTVSLNPLKNGSAPLQCQSPLKRGTGALAQRPGVANGLRQLLFRECCTGAIHGPTYSGERMRFRVNVIVAWRRARSWAL